MKASFRKNIKLRKDFAKTELKLNIQKFLSINLLNTPIIKNKKGILLYLPKITNSQRTKVKSTCVLTGRTASTNNNFSISRIKLRSFMQLGLIPGYKKAVW